MSLFKSLNIKKTGTKFLFLAFFILLIIIPFWVFGQSYEGKDTGYKLPAHWSKKQIYYHSSSVDTNASAMACFNNNSDNSYFVPTRTLLEMNKFFAKASTINVSPDLDCCGDGICSSVENSSTCPGDCGSAYVCPASIVVPDTYAGM